MCVIALRGQQKGGGGGGGEQTNIWLGRRTSAAVSPDASALIRNTTAAAAGWLWAQGNKNSQQALCVVLPPWGEQKRRKLPVHSIRKNDESGREDKEKERSRGGRGSGGMPRLRLSLRCQQRVLSASCFLKLRPRLVIFFLLMIFFWTLLKSQKMSNSAICLIEKKAVRERDGKSLRALFSTFISLPLCSQCVPLWAGNFLVAHQIVMCH